MSGDPKGEFRTLDTFTLADIRAGKDFENRIREFYWRHYAELAQQRDEIVEDLREALLIAAMEGRNFKSWQRVVRYRRSNRPLSLAGSLISPGGRFNIAAIDEARFPPFPALYLAEDKETAIREAFPQDPKQGAGKLSALEYALAKSDSFSVLSMSGRIETVIDLSMPERLSGFVNLIREFRLSESLQKQGRELAKEMSTRPATLLKLVRTTSKLLEAVLAYNWRELPVQLGMPSSPQIFGQLVSQSGVEAIQYPSKFTGKPCLAVFPKTFTGASSHVSLDDVPPRKDVITRLDRDNWQALCK